MNIASHTELGSGHRLNLLEICGNGLAIFEDLDAEYSRIKCPMTPEHVIPFHERSTANMREENGPLYADNMDESCDCSRSLVPVLQPVLRIVK